MEGYQLVLNRRMAWVEKDLNDYLVSTPCQVQGCQPLEENGISHKLYELPVLLMYGWGIQSWTAETGE